MSQHAISRAAAAPAERCVTQSTLRAGGRRRVPAWQRRELHAPVSVERRAIATRPGPE